ncbi:hypothetical protein EGW08_005037 [Elysia chlorotica]|uniref:IRS-type PTB domain-containing protein n=1 Tax=Elysia chlorotica TaxID=188477 RepID=A0A3S1AB27_ELYCH|nr:hypothetical protein EGW08_005037 [Elysia chlorotica]
MEDDDDYIYQGDVLRLSESKKRLIGSKSDTWKPKYLIARRKGDKLVLEYHKRKPKVSKRPEKTITDTFELSPVFKVEKLNYQGDVLRLSESKKRLIGSKSDTWKPKYLIARRKGDKLVLEYHKRKPKVSKRPEKTITDTFELSPVFKVEKLRNARGRSFVCEITAPEFHIFLSTDAEKDIDILVFLLQSQIRLKNDIKKDVIVVVPEDTESQQRIGAKGSKCLLHASPWGLTLALENTRSLLAQWPLKSIRYYETSGRGNFNIEAGRVAPMGEGLFQFKTQPGDDDFLYDLVDSYIINTLDRVKPTQKGTAEEIEEYIREHDNLYTLTTLSLCTPKIPAIKRALRVNWGVSIVPSDGERIGAGTSHSSRSRRSDSSQAAAPGTPMTQPSPSLSTRSGQSSLLINLERPGDTLDSRGNSLDSRASRSSEDSSLGRHAASDRPPPLPSRGGGVPRRSRRRDHSIPRKVDVIGQNHHDDSVSVASSSQGPNNPSSPRLSISSTLSAAASSTGSLRRHSNPSAVLHKVENSDSHIMDSLSINTNLGNSITNSSVSSSSSSQHTEFYNLSSPNMKVRVSKSPLVTRNPNKVGRAEYLMSQSQSGVKSPTSPSLSTHSSMLGDQNEPVWTGAARSPEDDHQDALDYLGAVARASQQKYGGSQPGQQGSLDRHWGKVSRQVSGSDQSTTSATSSPSAGGGNSRKVAGGYVNLPNSPGAGTALSPPREIIHSRQRSAPEAMLDVRSLGNTSFVSQSSTEEQYLVPPPLAPKHSRQHSADDSGRPGLLDLDPSVQIRPKSAGSKRDGVTRSGDSALVSPGEMDASGGRSPAEREAARRQLKGFSSPEEGVGGSVGSSIADWMVSASCEDLSDHMRTAIYDRSDSEFHDQGNTYDEIDSHPADEDKHPVSSSVGSNSSGKFSEKPPLPFTGLKKFQSNTDYGRDRSKSFGYINIPNSAPTNSSSGGSSNPKPQSTAPSAHLIRKMVNARSKQETLRKSLSNPNFLNLGSKEHLFAHKSAGVPGSSGRLAPVQKQKSRSFGSLFFPAIRKALSRESLGGRGRSVTPERRASNSRSTTPEGRRSRSFSFRRRNSEGGNSRANSLRRRDSFHGPGEMTIKGIRMTARSRSFRRVRGAKSEEVLTDSANNLNADDQPAASTTTNSANASPQSKASVSVPTQRKISAPVPSARHSSTATAAASVPSSMAESEPAGSAVSTLVYTTLSFAHLPPVPHPDIPPPLPARRKSEPENLPPELPSRECKPGSNHTSSNYMNLRRNSRKGSHDQNSEAPLPPQQNTTGSDHSEVSTSRKPRVSDIVAKIEDTANNNNPSTQNGHEGRRNKAKSQVYKNDDGVTLRGPSWKSKPVTQRGTSQDHSKPPVRPSSRTKSGGYPKSEVNSPRESSGNDFSPRNNQQGRVRPRSGQKHTRSEVLAQSSSHKPSQSQSSTEGAESQAKSAETKKNQVIIPFQPIPFKRQTNGISSVKAPSRSSFSSAPAGKEGTSVD